MNGRRENIYENIFMIVCATNFTYYSRIEFAVWEWWMSGFVAKLP